MKRIIAALKGMVEKSKIERKVNRINRASETAIDNAKDTIERLEEEKAELLSQLASDTDVCTIISKISQKIGEQEEQEEIIKRMEKVSKYINEEITIEEEK